MSAGRTAYILESNDGHEIERNTTSSAHVSYRAVKCEKFIAEVKKREPLWNRFIRQHKDSSLLNALWKEIGKIFHMSVPDAKKFWKNMVDQFRRHLKVYRNRPTGSGATDNSRIKWPYFSQMMFVAASITNRQTPRNMPRLQMNAVDADTSSTQSPDLEESIGVADCVKEEDMPQDETTPEEARESLFTPPPLQCDSRPISNSDEFTSDEQAPRPKRQRKDMALMEVADVISRTMTDVGRTIQNIHDEIAEAEGRRSCGSESTQFFFFKYIEMRVRERVPIDLQEHCEHAISEVVRFCCEGQQVTVVPTSSIYTHETS